MLEIPKRKLPVRLITDEQVDTLEELAEKADLAITAAQRPVTLGLGMQAAGAALSELRDSLRVLHATIVGYSTWQDTPSPR